MKKNIMKFIAALLGISGACHAQGKNEPVMTVSAAEFEQQIAEDSAQVVDVRTGEEFMEGHIANARQIDVTRPDFLEQTAKALDKNRVCYVYCRSGKRSLQAARLLAQQGYRIVNLRGGYMEWTEYEQSK